MRVFLTLFWALLWAVASHADVEDLNFFRGESHRFSNPILTESGFQIYDFKAKSNGFNYRGTLYYASPQAETIVAFHGLAANTITWESMGKHLNQLGFNFLMINQIGHGVGRHRSKAQGLWFRQLLKTWTNNLSSVARFQWPDSAGGLHNANMSMLAVKEAMILTSRIFKQKVTVLGHSFGAMTTSTALSGVQVLENGVGISDPNSFQSRREAQRLAREVVHGHVSIGMPGHFDSYPEAMKTLAGYLETFFRRAVFPAGITEFTLPFLPVLQPYAERDTRIEKAHREMLTALAKFAAENNLLPGVFEEWNAIFKIYNTPELYAQWIKFLSSGVSGLNLDLVADFTRYAREYDWAKTFNREIPSVFIIGENDRLAHPEGTLNHVQMRRQVSDIPILVLTVQEVGHLGIVVGDLMAKAAAPFVVMAHKGGIDRAWFRNFVEANLPSHDIKLDLKAQRLKFYDSTGQILKGEMSVDQLYEKMLLKVPQVKRKTRIMPPEKFREKENASSADCQTGLAV